VGLTKLTIEVGNPADPRRTARVTCLLDSGVQQAVIPRRVLTSLGLHVQGSEQFALLNGEHVERDLGAAVFRYHGRVGRAAVLFGEETDAALVGMQTLEALGLTLDPLHRTLTEVTPEPNGAHEPSPNGNGNGLPS
jgi:predicted aspartyl protease